MRNYFRSFCYFIILLSISTQADNKQNFSPLLMQTSAQSSFIREDHFQSYRLYNFLIENYIQTLEPTDIENYVLSSFIIKSFKDFKSECDFNSENKSKQIEFRFYCAKTMIFFGYYNEGLSYLEKIPPNFHRLEFHLIRATGFLYSGKSNLCLNELSIAQKKVTDFTSSQFRDLLNLSHARCFVESKLFSQALEKFQSISTQSVHYQTSMEEQAWVHFKARNLLTSRNLLSILSSQITSQSQYANSYPLYYRVKYLQGYIDLISGNPQGAKETFDIITKESSDYSKANLRIHRIVNAVVKDAQNMSSKLELSKSKAYSQFHSFTKLWIPTTLQNESDTATRFLFAINQELKRSLEPSYKSNLVKLKDSHLKYFSDIQKVKFNISKQSLDSIIFKSNMGQVENIWAQRTEGKRTLAEALEIYNLEVKNVEEYLGK